MKHKIYLLSLLLFSSISLKATVYNGTCGDNVTWNLDTETGELVISGSGAMNTTNGAPWSNYRTSITSVTINNGVTIIDNYAFNSCTQLTSVYIPSSVTNIYYSAFSGCTNLTDVHITNLAAWCNISFGSDTANPLYYAHHLFINGIETTDLIIPEGVTSIGNYAFYKYSGLTSVSIPNSVTSIGNRAFYFTGLTSITISNYVTTIGDAAFSNCSGLTSVSIGNGITSIRNQTFYGCGGLTDIVIPNSVTRIEYGAFGGCYNLKSINIPNNVTTIGERAFSGCTRAKTVIIPASVTSIESWAFEDNNAVTDVYCFANLANLTWGAVPKFKDNQATYFHVNDVSAWENAYPTARVTFVGNLSNYTCGNNVIWKRQNDSIIISGTGPMYDYSEGTNSSPWSHSIQIGKIVISEGVTSIGGSSFYECIHISSVSIPNTVTSIGDYSFYNCSTLVSINFPNTISYIGTAAFFNCKALTSVTIPSNVTSISEDVFGYCSGLTSVTIPNSVTTIGRDAFDQCSGLTSIAIPNSVTSIAAGAFTCSNLSAVHITDLAAWCNIYFGNYNANPLKYAHHLFLNGIEITDLVIPNGIERLYSNAFYNCSSLTSVTIPNSVTKVGSEVFCYCSNLTSITCYATTPPTASSYSFNSGLPDDIVLYVLNESCSSYASATGWNAFTRIRAITKTTTIGSTGWTTFSCDAPLDLDNMEASTGTPEAYYAYNAAGSTVNLRATTATVPAGEGLMLKGDNGATITIPVAASGTSIEGNKLVGCPSGATITKSTPNYANIYVLANNEGTAQFENVQSYVASHNLSIGAGKAYLNLAGVSLAPGALGIAFEEDNATKLEALAETDTAVKFIENGQLLILRDGVTYDAMGRVIR